MIPGMPSLPFPVTRAKKSGGKEEGEEEEEEKKSWFKFQLHPRGAGEKCLGVPSTYKKWLSVIHA